VTNFVSLNDCAHSAVEDLLDAAFGKDRKSRTAYLLRDGSSFIPPLSFGLQDESGLVGAIQCWPVKLVAGTEIPAPLVLVGPVAVHPDLQNLGYGTKLMHAMLKASEGVGHPPMVMIGDPEYYVRFGFFADATGGWSLPGPWEAHRLLLRNVAGHKLPEIAALCQGNHQY
jgi:predicted N-acetyltransferase YhbS